MQPIIYLISGLAADQRIFKNLRLEAEVRFLPWLAPLHPDEPLHKYAEGMAATIIPDRPGLIVGVSFGGLVALEIAQKRPWLQVVQISSINHPSQMPWHLKLIGLSKAYLFTPPELMKLAPWAGTFFFGTKGDEEAELFGQILHDADPAYMRWAIPQLLNWEPPKQTACIQINGTEDRVFPVAHLPDNIIRIEGGTHLMVLSEAEKISKILNELAQSWVAAYEQKNPE